MAKGRKKAQIGSRSVKSQCLELFFDVFLEKLKSPGDADVKALVLSSGHPSRLPLLRSNGELHLVRIDLGVCGAGLIVGCGEA